MSIRDTLRGAAVNLLVERPARNKSIAELAATLEAAAEKVEQRIARCREGKPKNVETLRHIIGIERWGQQRLRGFLGETVAQDEYDGYRPDDVDSVSQLRSAFVTTRAETVRLARQLQAHDPPRTATVVHNDLGPLTARGWLRYLTTHANLESRRLT